MGEDWSWVGEVFFFFVIFVNYFGGVEGGGGAVRIFFRICFQAISR